MARDWYVLGLVAVVAVTGCSGRGGVDEAEAAAAPTLTMPAKMKARVATDSASDSLSRAREMEVMRETFTYQGATRDPFNSLVTGLSVGPELADLLLVGIYEDMRTPSNSVVVLREKQGEKRHKLRTGDELGRIRLVQIRSREAVFKIQDLGFERQETLSLRKQEEATP